MNKKRMVLVPLQVAGIRKLVAVPASEFGCEHQGEPDEDGLREGVYVYFGTHELDNGNNVSITVNLNVWDERGTISEVEVYTKEGCANVDVSELAGQPIAVLG